MTRFEQEVVLRKVQLILRHLSLLQRYSNTAEQEFLENVEQQLVVERLLHLIIESAIDINNHLLVSRSASPADTYFSSFIQLGQLGILPRELAQSLAPSAGLRSHLVHQYETIDPILVYQAIGFALTQYPQYIEAIQAYLAQQ